MKKALPLFLFTLLLFACSKKNEENLIFEAKINELCNRDTSTISYSNDIAPILNSDCMPCHSTARQDGGIALDNYSDASTYAGGNLLDAVKQINGASPMPKGAPKLHECKIHAIETWINAGTPNN